MIKLLATLILILNVSTIAQCQSHSKKQDRLLDSLLKRKIECKLAGGEIGNIPRENVTNAEFGYAYLVPLTFKEAIQDPNTYSDTDSYVSPDKKCLLKLWPGQTVSFPLGAVDRAGKPIGIKSSDIMRVEKAVNNYIKLLKPGNDRELKNVKIVEFCEGISGFDYQIALKGISGEYGYIYKVDVSEIPVSGDLVFKNFLYRYDIQFKEKYEEIGIAMANRFTGL